MNSALNQEPSFVRSPENPVHVLFVGVSLKAVSSIFQREDEIVRCDHASSSGIALEMIVAQAKARSFDCVVVDMRHEDDGTPLNVVAIAALRTFGTLTVLANQDNANDFRSIVGVDDVMVAPVQPMDLIKKIVACAPPKGGAVEELVAIPKGNLPPPGEVSRGDEIKKFAREKIERTSVTPAAPTVSTKPSAGIPKADKKSGEDISVIKAAVTKGFASSLETAQNADNQVWQRFVPLANFFYKKLAIIILSALFLTFVTYGAMIVFFMANTSWSMPFELSRGHVLVEKVERELSLMKIRKNQVQQNLTVATVEQKNAARDMRDGELQLLLTLRTIEEEVSLHEKQRLEITSHIGRLRKVIKDFSGLSGNGNLAKNLRGAFSKRLITRKALNNGTLAVLGTLHRIATLQNEISQNQLELLKIDNKMKFLNSLSVEMSKPEVSLITSAGSELAHLAREAIAAKTLIANSSNAYEAASERTARLQNSLGVVSANIASLSATPAARAMKSPVMVLFVPYSNAANVKAKEPLYSCSFTIVACSRIGEVGKPIEGETNAVHPLFGKPMRGTFVEAEFADPRSVTAELVHAGGTPVLF